MYFAHLDGLSAAFGNVHQCDNLVHCHPLGIG